MTVTNLVSHSDNNAIGSSRVVERFYPGRAGCPLVAAKFSDSSPPLVGTQKGGRLLQADFFICKNSHNHVYPCILTLVSRIWIR